MIHKKTKQGKEERIEGKKKKRREERRKGKEDHRYGTMSICMETMCVWNLLSSVWKSIDFCTIVWICLVLV